MQSVERWLQRWLAHIDGVRCSTLQVIFTPPVRFAHALRYILNYCRCCAYDIADGLWRFPFHMSDELAGATVEMPLSKSARVAPWSSVCRSLHAVIGDVCTICAGVERHKPATAGIYLTPIGAGENAIHSRAVAALESRALQYSISRAHGANVWQQRWAMTLTLSGQTFLR
jgi:hypothetical protein